MCIRDRCRIIHHVFLIYMKKISKVHGSDGGFSHSMCKVESFALSIAAFDLILSYGEHLDLNEDCVQQLVLAS